MDFFVRTTDNNIFVVAIEGSKSYDLFRSTFEEARIASVNPDNYDAFLEGPRAFLETSSI